MEGIMVYISFSERLVQAIVGAGGIATLVSRGTLDQTLRSLKGEKVRILASGDLIGYAIKSLQVNPEAEVLVPIKENVASTKVIKKACRVDIPGIGNVPVWVLTRSRDPDKDPQDGWEYFIASEKPKK